jgi:hypothetical protein
MGIAADQRRRHFHEIEHPERQVEIVRADRLDQAPKEAAYSLWTSRMTT